MSLKRFHIINRLINKYDLKKYCEIGIRSGTSFKRVNCENKIGVDPNPIYKDIEYKITSDEFFENGPPEGIDIFFIDGDHSHQQSLKDIINCYNYLPKGGIIVCHDCFPKNYDYQFESNIDKGYSGKVWMSILNLTSKFSGCESYVIDTDGGCGVIIKDEELTLTYDDLFETYEWEDFPRYKENIRISRRAFKSICKQPLNVKDE